MDINFTSTPTIASLRKYIKAAETKGETQVNFTYGEQFSEFSKFDGRWNHHGNGLMKAAYKLDNELSAQPRRPQA